MSNRVRKNNEEKRIFHFKKEQLQLACEWCDCNEVIPTMEEFLRHVSKHLEKGMTSGVPCCWRDCGYMSETFPEFNLHVNFHAFHTKLKCLGANLLMRKGLQNCSLNNNTRNCIPELPENLICGWANCGVLDAFIDMQNRCQISYQTFLKLLNERVHLIGNANMQITGNKLNNTHHEDGPFRLVVKFLIEVKLQAEFVFQSPELYYRHVDQHVDDVPEQSIKCQWEGCEGQFQNGHKLRDHFRSHTQEKLIACPTCGGLFSNRTKFFDHIKRQTPLEDQHYQCTHCSKRLASERLLRDHIRNHINHYKCPCCDMTCSSPSNLNNHIKYRHSNTRPYTCGFCDYSGKSQADLFKHLRTHLSEPQHKCPQEDCTFVTRSEHCLKIHVFKKHKKTDLCRYVCHLCKKRFARGAYLTRHLFRNHKLRWPSGHSRFRYQRNQDGDYYLQTIRYESIELTQELIDQKCDDEDEEQADKISDSSNEDTSEIDEHGQDTNDDVTESVTPTSSSDLVDIASCASYSVNAESQDKVFQSWGLNDKHAPSDYGSSSRTVLATISGPSGINHVIHVLVDDSVNMALNASGES